MDSPKNYYIDKGREANIHRGDILNVYREKFILRSINFEVRQSGFVALLGGFVSESFSWSSVELSSDVIAIVLSD